MDVDILDNMGYNALHHSIMNYSCTREDSFKTVQCLIDDGRADLTITAGDGKNIMGLLFDNPTVRIDINVVLFLVRRLFENYTFNVTGINRAESD
jgi:hypothetical protein